MVFEKSIHARILSAYILEINGTAVIHYIGNPVAYRKEVVFICGVTNYFFSLNPNFSGFCLFDRWSRRRMEWEVVPQEIQMEGGRIKYSGLGVCFAHN